MTEVTSTWNDACMHRFSLENKSNSANGALGARMHVQRDSSKATSLHNALACTHVSSHPMRPCTHAHLNEGPHALLLRLLQALQHMLLQRLPSLQLAEPPYAACEVAALCKGPETLNGALDGLPGPLRKEVREERLRRGAARGRGGK